MVARHPVPPHWQRARPGRRRSARTHRTVRTCCGATSRLHQAVASGVRQPQAQHIRTVGCRVPRRFGERGAQGGVRPAAPAAKRLRSSPGSRSWPVRAYTCPTPRSPGRRAALTRHVNNEFREPVPEGCQRAAVIPIPLATRLAGGQRVCRQGRESGDPAECRRARTHLEADAESPQGRVVSAVLPHSRRSHKGSYGTYSCRMPSMLRRDFRSLPATHGARYGEDPGAAYAAPLATASLSVA